MPELEVLTERLRQQAKARRDAIADRLRRAQAADAMRRGAHGVGDRVFDLVSGVEGEVVHVARENVVVPAAR